VSLRKIYQLVNRKRIIIPDLDSFQTVYLDWKKLKAEVKKNEIRATWLGHATSLVQFSNGLNVLFDPLLEEYMGEGPNWIRKLTAPKRDTKLPCKAEDFKKHGVTIHVICISHNHHDHYDPKTINKLRKDFPNVRVYSPTGTRPGQGGVELKWWSTDFFQLSNVDPSVCKTSRCSRRSFNVRITAMPAQHWSRRGIMDENDALWSGWRIYTSRDKKSVYFAGDTGYGQFFKEIGERFPIDLAILPIGAYKPKWFMNPQHISPEEAVQVFDDVKAKHALAVHWLTFQDLANERGVQPIKELEYYKYMRTSEEKKKKTKKDGRKFNNFIATPCAKIVTYR